MATLSLTRHDHLVSVQDAGRVGAMRYGVSQSGPMDWVRFSHALALIEKRATAAFEIGITGAEFAANGTVVAALTGPGFRITIESHGQSRTLAAPVRVLLSDGDHAKVSAGNEGMWAYFAVAGIDFGEPMLGSFATNVRTGLGARDLTAPFAITDGPLLDPFEALDIPLSDGPIALLPGPQQHLFPPAVQNTFVSNPYTLSAQTDRMGYKLEGAPLKALTHDIISDGIVEGAIQVPGNGQPIVLCADRAPTGGYPKIAILTTADRPRLTQSRPGTTLSFRWVTLDEANTMRSTIRTALDAPPQPRIVQPSAERLADVNLISGVVGSSEPL